MPDNKHMKITIYYLAIVLFISFLLTIIAGGSTKMKHSVDINSGYDPKQQSSLSTKQRNLITRKTKDNSSQLLRLQLFNPFSAGALDTTTVPRQAELVAQDDAAIYSRVTEALISDPGNVEELINAASLYKDLGILDQFRAFADASIQSFPDRTDIVHSISQFYIDVGRKEEALDILEKAVWANYENPLYHELLAATLEMLGENTEAVKAYQNIFFLDENNPGARYNLGRLYAEMGFPEQAGEEYERAFSLWESSEAFSADQ